MNQKKKPYILGSTLGASEFIVSAVPKISELLI